MTTLFQNKYLTEHHPQRQLEKIIKQEVELSFAHKEADREIQSYNSVEVTPK